MKSIKKYPSQAELVEIFTYCDSGNLYWKSHISNGTDISKPAGSLQKTGYIRIQINKSLFRLNRLIYIFHNGDIPEGLVIDHINDNISDNRIGNLQAITNQKNTSKRKTNNNNTSGYRGVCWDKRSNKWKAQLRSNGKQISIGLFHNKHDAALAYNIAAQQNFGEFAKLNELTSSF